MARSRGARSVDRSAIWAFVPVVAMAPFSVLALGLLWWPVNIVFGVPFRWTVVVFTTSGLLLFVRPFQTAVLTPILGARLAHPEEAALITPVWAEIAQANHLPPNRYALRVLPSDELNAFACGGHLVVVTSFAAQELTPAQLRGVLAHEISHHLGLHTVAITITHWLSGPVVFLARIGFFFENVSQAAAQSFGRRSPVIKVAGQFAATFFKAVSWVFTAALHAGDALGNRPRVGQCTAPGPRQRRGRPRHRMASTADRLTSGGTNTRRSDRSPATPPRSLNATNCVSTQTTIRNAVVVPSRDGDVMR
jgi:Zn-dependent protease with chaperone function